MAKINLNYFFHLTSFTTKDNLLVYWKKLKALLKLLYKKDIYKIKKK